MTAFAPSGSRPTIAIACRIAAISVPLANDGVHRPRPHGFRVHRVHLLHDGLLVWDRHIGAGHIGLTQSFQRFAQVRR
jgi:hypothetical protein